MPVNDDALLVAHRSGDPEAFEALVRRHGPRMLGYLQRVLGDAEEAQDAFQETFRRVHERAGQYRGNGRLVSWMYTIATNVVRDEWRRRGRRGVAVSLEALAGPEGQGEAAVAGVADPRGRQPWQAAVVEERRAAVRGAIGGLPERQRAVLVMAYYEGMSYPEIAAALGCRVGTVKTQMFRAVRTLGGKLRKLEGVCDE